MPSSLSVRHRAPKDTVLHRMTPNVPRVSAGDTIAEVQQFLRAHSRSLETINYLYIVDANGRLTGVLSVKELYHHGPAVKMGEVCKKDALVTIPEETHQERAVALALKHNLKAIPVVTHDKVLLGAIPSDAILSILYKEMHEDLLRLSGIHHARGGYVDNVFQITLWQSLSHRIPWLLIGIVGGLLSARIIGGFESVLQRHILLAAFIPLIVYVGGAVVTQLQAFIIRDLAIDGNIKLSRYMMKQVASIFAISVLLGGLMFLIALLYYGDSRVGRVLGISVGFAALSAAVSGLVIPFLFYRLKLDPANASGPIATIVQDMMSVVIYFSVAAWLL